MGNEISATISLRYVHWSIILGALSMTLLLTMVCLGIDHPLRYMLLLPPTHTTTVVSIFKPDTRGIKR